MFTRYAPSGPQICIWDIAGVQDGPIMRSYDASDQSTVYRTFRPDDPAIESYFLEPETYDPANVEPDGIFDTRVYTR